MHLMSFRWLCPCTFRELKCVGKFLMSVGTHMRGLGDWRSRVSLSTRAFAACSPPEKEGLKRKIALFSSSHQWLTTGGRRGAGCGREEGKRDKQLLEWNWLGNDGGGSSEGAKVCLVSVARLALRYYYCSYVVRDFNKLLSQMIKF